jgi:hypothetical protein
MANAEEAPRAAFEASAVPALVLPYLRDDGSVKDASEVCRDDLVHLASLVENHAEILRFLRQQQRGGHLVGVALMSAALEARTAARSDAARDLGANATFIPWAFKAQGTLRKGRRLESYVGRRRKGAVINIVRRVRSPRRRLPRARRPRSAATRSSARSGDSPGNDGEPRCCRVASHGRDLTAAPRRRGAPHRGVNR